jgi:hypothetical protein
VLCRDVTDIVAERDAAVAICPAVDFTDITPAIKQINYAA